MDKDTNLMSLKKSEDEEIPEEDDDVPYLGLPRLIAYRREPKRASRLPKLSPEAQLERNDYLAECDYCQKLCRPFAYSEPIFCCERSKQLRELVEEERKKLVQKEAERKIDVESGGHINDEKTAKGPGRKKLRQHQIKTRQCNYDRSLAKQKPSCFKVFSSKTDEKFIPKWSLTLLPPREEIEGEPKTKVITQKFYKSGKCFLTLFQDGTGNVFYPSGNAAIIISSEDADFTYIILEDKDKAPTIKGIFTNQGHSTCHHPSGSIWLNLTPGGGVCFSETGDLKMHWNWFYFDTHVRNLPFKPLIFTLVPHISVHIHSHECMYVTFAHKENTVRFNVGSKLKPVHSEIHKQPCQSDLEQYIQRKRTEFFSLLCQMQTCLSYPSANLHNIKPHYRFIAQKERLSKQVEKRSHPKKIKAHANKGENT